MLRPDMSGDQQCGYLLRQQLAALASGVPVAEEERLVGPEAVGADGSVRWDAGRREERGENHVSEEQRWPPLPSCQAHSNVSHDLNVCFFSHCNIREVN